MRTRCFFIFFLVTLLKTQFLFSCPSDFRRFDETYHLHDYTVIVDSFWMDKGHLFLVTFKSPPIVDSQAKILFTLRSSRKILSVTSSFRLLEKGIYRAYVFIDKTELYGKVHLQISGRLLGSEKGIEVVFKRDLRPFLPHKTGQCY